MPHQVDGALLRAPCPVPSCPAYEPNSGSVFLSLTTKPARVEEEPTLLCNQVELARKSWANIRSNIGYWPKSKTTKLFGASNLDRETLSDSWRIERV